MMKSQIANCPNKLEDLYTEPFWDDWFNASSLAHDEIRLSNDVQNVLKCWPIENGIRRVRKVEWLYKTRWPCGLQRLKLKHYDVIDIAYTGCSAKNVRPGPESNLRYQLLATSYSLAWQKVVLKDLCVSHCLIIPTQCKFEVHLILSNKLQLITVVLLEVTDRSLAHHDIEVIRLD